MQAATARAIEVPIAHLTAAGFAMGVVATLCGGDQLYRFRLSAFQLETISTIVTGRLL